MSTQVNMWECWGWYMIGGQQYKSLSEKDSDTPPKMSFAFQLARQTTRNTLGVRAFHSPFAVLGTSPLTTPHAPSPQQDSSTISEQYEKQYDHAHHEPTTTHGYRTYVVSEPDSSYKHYQVPAGAYPTSAPYINFGATAAPDTAGAEYSSTGGELLAHGFTTRAARHHSGGVGDSAAVRFKEAPGEMGARGGSYGGIGMMTRRARWRVRENWARGIPSPMTQTLLRSFRKRG